MYGESGGQDSAFLYH